VPCSPRFNVDEIQVCMEYVKKLTTDTSYGWRPEPKDVGIITPYGMHVLSVSMTVNLCRVLGAVPPT
jgi:hypothetical protein